jgi:hypothetical protein
MVLGDLESRQQLSVPSIHDGIQSFLHTRAQVSFPIKGVTQEKRKTEKREEGEREHILSNSSMPHPNQGFAFFSFLVWESNWRGGGKAGQRRRTLSIPGFLKL